MSLCLVAIFKNEGHIIKEWIEHYLNQGVDKLYLIDNDSNDNYQEKIQKYLDNNIVEIVVDTKKHSQTELYNKHYLTKSKNYDWVMVCDLDEFIYARKGFSTIKHYLNSLHFSIGQIFIPWKIFGSNGYNDLSGKPYSNIIQTFTKRINYNKKDGFEGVEKVNDEKFSLTKCIVRTPYLVNFEIHSHEILNSKNIRNITSNHEKNSIHKNVFAKIDEKILEDSFLHLNHYAIQSLGWFLSVKCSRGAANTNNNIRNENYFKQFDSVSNDIDDFELSNISKKHL
jgi:hypothetical protein